MFVVYKSNNGRVVIITSHENEVRFLADNKYNIDQDFKRTESIDDHVMVESPVFRLPTEPALKVN